MGELERHRRIWRALTALIARPLRRRFSFTPEVCRAEAPCLVISNHVTNWDPLLIALSFPRDQMYFVASEHILRLGFISSIIRRLVDPIPRSKAASGVDTVRECLRRLRAGASVCLFAEGDCTWNGRSGEVFPATGKLAKTCGATLVTYRFEGAYLTFPRWGTSLRSGQMRGGVVNTYSVQELRSMTVDEVNAAINRDIYEDAWERERAMRVPYKSKALAESIENALFVCPKCHKTGGLASSGDLLKCSCGFETRVSEYGSFEPPEPFENAAEWDAWQRQLLASGDFDWGAVSDGVMKLSEILSDHAQRELCTGELRLAADSLSLGERRFAFEDISGMSIVKSKVLLFSALGGYYEIRSDKPCCMRRYLLAWQIFREKAKA